MSNWISLLEFCLFLLCSLYITHIQGTMILSLVHPKGYNAFNKVLLFFNILLNTVLLNTFYLLRPQNQYAILVDKLQIVISSMSNNFKTLITGKIQSSMLKLILLLIQLEVQCKADGEIDISLILSCIQTLTLEPSKIFCQFQLPF